MIRNSPLFNYTDRILIGTKEPVDRIVIYLSARYYIKTSSNQTLEKRACQVGCRKSFRQIAQTRVLMYN